MEKTSIWTIGAVLNWTRQYFSGRGVDNPRLDAEVLLSHILGRDRLYLYVNFDKPLEPSELAAFREAVAKRARRLPVAYITGRKEFMGLEFEVSPAVLIPRPDTEILVEAVLEILHVRQPGQRILDLGTGSGAIIVSLLKFSPDSVGAAVDISPEALKVAGRNAAFHRVSDRLKLYQGDLFEPVGGQTFDIIVSNPPYIPDGDLAGLAPEVKTEPELALAGGKDGLAFYRRILAACGSFLNPGGMVFLEVGQGQAQSVAGLAPPETEVVRIAKDYAGIDRVVILSKLEQFESKVR